MICACRTCPLSRSLAWLFRLAGVNAARNAVSLSHWGVFTASLTCRTQGDGKGRTAASEHFRAFSFRLDFVMMSVLTVPSRRATISSPSLQTLVRTDRENWI